MSDREWFRDALDAAGRPGDSRCGVNNIVALKCPNCGANNRDHGRPPSRCSACCTDYPAMVAVDMHELAELQAKAAKWDAHERDNPIGCANMETGSLRLNFEHGPETYDSLRKHFLRLRIKFGTTDPKRMQGPKRPVGMTFAASDPVPTLGGQVEQHRRRTMEQREYELQRKVESGEIKTPAEYLAALEALKSPAKPTIDKIIPPGQAYILEGKPFVRDAHDLARYVDLALNGGTHGPGLSARYPDATKPETNRPEHITVDLSGDWD